MAWTLLIIQLRGKVIRNQYKLSQTAFEVLTDNGKPSERVGRKADRPKLVVRHWSFVIR